MPSLTRSDIKPLMPTLIAVAVTIAIGVFGVRGADYPAHYVRAMVWEQAHGTVWNNLWYAGHPTLPYSVLAPALMAIFGPFLVVAIGSIVATYCFSRLTLELLPSATTQLANHTFAVAMLVNVVVGRAPFALGLACGLVAVRAWHRDRFELALVAAVLAPLISPVAGAFLGLAGIAVAFAAPTAERWRGIAIAVVATAPVVLVSAMFGEPVWFPYRGGHFVVTVAVLALVAVSSRVRTVRYASIAGAVAACAVYVVPNPLGGNYVRLAQIVAVPLAVIALAHVRKAMLVPFGLCLAAAVCWSVQPAVVAAVEWGGDASVEPAFHQPLIERVKLGNADGRPVGRLEIPFTENHWESLYVAPEVPFARGWERQLDLARNAPLYDAELSLDGYHRWLHDYGVRWIALPDVALDHAGEVEQRLVSGAAAGEIAWLRRVWSSADWQLFEVEDYTPIVGTPAEFVGHDPDSVMISTPRKATVTIKYRYTDRLTITGGAEVEPDGRGWIIAHLPAAGEYRLSMG
jgi:hypothetical protein